MKIGIITFHRTVNYGAVLQAYALQKAVEKQGNEVETIDYRNMDIYGYCDPDCFAGQSIKTKIGKIIRYSYNKKVFSRFERFWDEKMKWSRTCATRDELRMVEKEYDAVICGSDQVWNPKAIKNDFEAYLLGTAECRRISYAASAGNVSLWEPYLKTYWELLHRFHALSVRESDMQLPAEHLSQKSVQVVLDPTLLLRKDDWFAAESTETVTSLPEKGYILVYFLGNNPEVVQAAKEMQSKTGLPIISLGRKVKGVRAYRPAAGPQEFLALFHHASYVLTSSFHGTVFSIQYRRPFLVFGNGAYNSRMNTLLQLLGIEERMWSGAQHNIEEAICAPIDWDTLESRLETEQEHSIAFLKEALDDTEKG